MQIAPLINWIDVSLTLNAIASSPSCAEKGAKESGTASAQDTALNDAAQGVITTSLGGISSEPLPLEGHTVSDLDQLLYDMKQAFGTAMG